MALPARTPLSRLGPSTARLVTTGTVAADPFQQSSRRHRWDVSSSAAVRSSLCHGLCNRTTCCFAMPTKFPAAMPDQLLCKEHLRKQLERNKLKWWAAISTHFPSDSPSIAEAVSACTNAHPASLLSEILFPRHRMSQREKALSSSDIWSVADQVPPPEPTGSLPSCPPDIYVPSSSGRSETPEGVQQRSCDVLEDRDSIRDATKIVRRALGPSLDANHVDIVQTAAAKRFPSLPNCVLSGLPRLF